MATETTHLPSKPLQLDIRLKIKDVSGGIQGIDDHESGNNILLWWLKDIDTRVAQQETISSEGIKVTQQDVLNALHIINNGRLLCMIDPNVGRGIQITEQNDIPIPIRIRLSPSLRATDLTGPSIYKDYGIRRFAALALKAKKVLSGETGNWNVTFKPENYKGSTSLFPLELPRYFLLQRQNFEVVSYEGLDVSIAEQQYRRTATYEFLEDKLFPYIHKSKGKPLSAGELARMAIDFKISFRKNHSEEFVYDFSLLSDIQNALHFILNQPELFPGSEAQDTLRIVNSAVNIIDQLFLQHESDLKRI